MLDVLLINPKSREVLPSYLPYGILSIAALLRSKGLKVNIYDSNVEDSGFEYTLRKLKPKIVGFSVLSGPCISDACIKSEQVRKFSKDIKIIWGGVHPTFFPEIVLKEPYVDYVIRNEGEYPMFELAEVILNKKGDLSKIRNLCYKDDSKIYINEMRPFIDLDKLPHPAWDLVPVEKYVNMKFYSNRVLTLHSSKGCPWACTYCYNESFNFRKWRGLSADKIVAQIIYLKEKYNIRGIQFYDDQFDANPKRVVEFCNLLIKKNLKIYWSHYSRTNTACKERYILAKQAGCRLIEFGVESGSPRILRMIRKEQSIENIKNAFNICHEISLSTGAMFMVGMPTETKDDVDLTIKLVRSLKAHQTINTIFRPYPGSTLFKYCIDKGLFHLPNKLAEQGEAFNITTSEINVSKVPTNYLQQVHNSFDFNNVKNELIFCLKHRNWKLLLFYAKNRLRWHQIKWILRGIWGYFKTSWLKKHKI